MFHKIVVICILLAVFELSTANAFSVGYYRSSCPTAEFLVFRTVLRYFLRDKTVPAGLIRLHFHDCFVEGCDGSILLDSTPSGDPVEKEALPNKNSARGFDIIEGAKRSIEESCPGVVSCADILALAARDAVFITSHFFYQVKTGRLDGKTSLASEANVNLPPPFFSVPQLKDFFKRKGLSSLDLVVLSGAHSLGRAHCALFSTRLYNFSGTGLPDPSLSKCYLNELRRICPETSPKNSPDPTAQLDNGTEFLLDNSYYRQLLKQNGLFSSDQALVDDAESFENVKDFARNNMHFLQQFAKSMQRMGEIDLKTDGEVRSVCSTVNKISPN